MSPIKRTILIGDVHGCFDELESLLKKASFQKAQDRLIFVGDLIHKGPKSYEVLELVDKLQPEVVLGNHERFFVQTCLGEKEDSQNLKTLKDRLGKKATKRWCEWMQELPTHIEDPNFLVVHAGLQPGKHPRDSKASLLTTIRTWDGKGENLDNPQDPAWYDFYKQEKLIVYGHWARQGLCIRKNTLGLDSGCLYGGYLSALILPTREILQVRAQRGLF